MKIRRRKVGELSFAVALKRLVYVRLDSRASHFGLKLQFLLMIDSPNLVTTESGHFGPQRFLLEL